AAHSGRWRRNRHPACSGPACGRSTRRLPAFGRHALPCRRPCTTHIAKIMRILHLREKLPGTKATVIPSKERAAAPPGGRMQVELRKEVRGDENRENVLLSSAVGSLSMGGSFRPGANRGRSQLRQRIHHRFEFSC